MNFSSISFAKALARERERKYRMTILTMVAEGMRKKGASERSIHTALEGFHEYLKPSRNTGKLEHPDPAATPELSDEEPSDVVVKLRAIIPDPHFMAYAIDHKQEQVSVLTIDTCGRR